MKRVDHFLHVEWGGDSHAGRHTEDPGSVLARIGTGQGTDERGLDYLLSGGQTRASKDGDWSETYICDLFDWHLKEQETMDWLTGTAQWVFKDFATPLRPENPVPRVNQKGLVARDLTPKEGYFVFQSYWAKKPMIRIYGHSWPVRWGAPGEKRLVRVYSNCDEAELFANGRSMGKRRRNSQDFPAAGLRWLLPLREGTYNLKAVGRKGAEEVSDTVTFRYQTARWEKPARLVLALAGQTADLAVVPAACLDAKGVMCLDARNLVRFGLTGDGRLVDNLGTPWAAREVQLANGRAQISARLGSGQSVLSLASAGLPTAFLPLGPPQPRRGG